MEMLVKMMEVLVKIAVMMMAPGGVPAPPKARGRDPPSSSSSLTFSLDGRRVSPLVLGLHGMGDESPSEIGSVSLSLSVSAFWDSALSPFLKFPEMLSSDWAEILTRSLSGY